MLDGKTKRSNSLVLVSAVSTALAFGCTFAVAARNATAATGGQADVVTEPGLTIEAALAVAAERSPVLARARAQFEEARARLVAARTYPFNPTVEGRAASRSGPSDSTDYEIELRQELEIAGQRGRRIDVAAAELDAARQRLKREQRIVAAGVHLAFVTALEAREMRSLAREEAALARDLLELTRRRLQAGAATRLDVNVAAAQAGRSEQALAEAEAAYGRARAILGETVGLPAGERPQPLGDLDENLETTVGLERLEALLESAVRNRADLLAVAQAERAARARIQLARREAWPNIEIGVFAGREEGSDTLVGAGLTIPLPLFQRNQGGIAEARAATGRVAAEHEIARLAVAREVTAAYETLRATRVALGRLRSQVVGSVHENVELLRSAFEAGKVGWVDVLVMRRALFDAQRAFLQTAAEARRAAVTLDLAAGRMPLAQTVATGAKR